MSDGLNLPFVDMIDWDAFTVTIPEEDFTKSRKHIIEILQRIVNNKALLTKKQRMLSQAIPHVIFGYGSPLEPAGTEKFKVVDHVLEAAFEGSVQDRTTQSASDGTRVSIQSPGAVISSL